MWFSNIHDVIIKLVDYLNLAYYHCMNFLVIVDSEKSTTCILINTTMKDSGLMIKLYNTNKHITLIMNKDMYNTLIDQMIQIQPLKINNMTFCRKS